MTHVATLFRIDKFAAPAHRREEFLARLHETHALMGEIDGCLQNLVLEQVSQLDNCRIATLVKWRDGNAYENARQLVQARYRAVGFDPPAYMRETSIEADLSTYRVLSTHVDESHASRSRHQEARHP